jgi:retinol dehydrogenase-13
LIELEEAENNHTRIALITGATGAIGASIAAGIAEIPNYETVLVARDETKAKSILAKIGQKTANPKIRYVLADLSRKTEIEALGNNWNGPLHVLVNNAAATPRLRKETAEGIEYQFATNVLAYFWMIDNFKEYLQQADLARIVNVASYWAGDLDLDDLEFKRRSYNNNIAYRQSKQANRMLTVAFAQRLQSSNISVNACHPGDVNSKLSSNLGFGGHQSPEQGAKTPIWLATSEIGYNQTGKYFENLREVRCPFGENKQAVEALYNICKQY